MTFIPKCKSCISPSTHSLPFWVSNSFLLHCGCIAGTDTKPQRNACLVIKWTAPIPVAWQQSVVSSLSSQLPQTPFCPAHMGGKNLGQAKVRRGKRNALQNNWVLYARFTDRISLRIPWKMVWNKPQEVKIQSFSVTLT